MCVCVCVCVECLHVCVCVCVECLHVCVECLHVWSACCVCRVLACVCRVLACVCRVLACVCFCMRVVCTAGCSLPASLWSDTRISYYKNHYTMYYKICSTLPSETTSPRMSATILFQGSPTTLVRSNYCNYNYLWQFPTKTLPTNVS